MQLTVSFTLSDLPLEEKNALLKRLGWLQDINGLAGTEAEQKAFCSLHRGSSVCFEATLTKGGRIVPQRLKRFRRVR